MVRTGGLAGLRQAAAPVVEEPEAEAVREEPAPRPVPQARALPVKPNGQIIGTADDLRKFGRNARPYVRPDGVTDYTVPAWDAADDQIPF